MCQIIYFEPLFCTYGSFLGAVGEGRTHCSLMVVLIYEYLVSGGCSAMGCLGAGEME